MKNILLLLMAIILYSSNTLSAGRVTPVTEYAIYLYDSSRERHVPVAVYSPANAGRNKVVIFNHGCGANKGGDYKLYSHITKELAVHGDLWMAYALPPSGVAGILLSHPSPINIFVYF